MVIKEKDGSVKFQEEQRERSAIVSEIERYQGRRYSSDMQSTWLRENFSASQLTEALRTMQNGEAVAFVLKDGRAF